MTNDNNPSKVVKWSLIVAIVILLNIFFNVTIGLFLDSPKYNDFCPVRYADQERFASEESCIENGGEWIEQKESYCDLYTKCTGEYDAVNEVYNLKVFIALLAFGLISFIAALLLKNPVVAISLSLAAALDFVIASIRYWSSANEWIRFAIVLIALVVLVYLAIKKFNDK